MGLVSYLAFLALISVSIGVLNLLPIPILDGGHLMFYLIEMVKGTPLSDKLCVYQKRKVLSNREVPFLVITDFVVV